MRANTETEKVDSYLASFPESTRKKLKQLRAAIRKAAPEAEEVISYGMPAYRYKGMLVYFSGFKGHIGFYALPTAHAKFKTELAAFKTGKGSVQFPLDRPLPMSLITAMVKFRVEENEARQAKK